ncbi:MAG: cobyrinate a,c-diamide synthase [Paracoccaceae bacterium]
MSGLLIAAPGSGAGKTTVTLALLRLLRRRGIAVRGAKSGPDYIDPRFHEAACGAPCPNLDAWAMAPERLRALAAGDGMLIVEGAMGLFDGAPPEGRGAAADVARALEIPVVLVVNASHMAQSVAPLVAGFAAHDRAVRIARVILNNVGSPRHEAMLRRALAPMGLPVLAALHRDPSLALPSRHLGLVQAEEREGLTPSWTGRRTGWANSSSTRFWRSPRRSPVLTDRLAAFRRRRRSSPCRDRAFAFTYPHLLADWRAAGAEVTFFSPLADEPVPEAGFVYLPGGYPELHAGRLAAAQCFRKA